MKRWMTNTGVKVGAALILTLCVLLFFSSIAGTAYLYGSNTVDKKGLKYYETDPFQYNLSDSAFRYMAYYYYNSDAGKKELEEIEKGDASDSGTQTSSGASGNTDGSTLYPITQWDSILGDMVAEIPRWDDFTAGSYQIKVNNYLYRVESTSDGKKKFINEDGSAAFVLYQSTEEYNGERTIGYLSGDFIDSNSFLMNYTNKALDDYLEEEAIRLIPTDDGRGDLYFDEDRNVVWIGEELSEGGEVTSSPYTLIIMDSVIYTDESREEDGHMDYIMSVVQNYSAGDFENMNIHMAIYSKSGGSADPAQTGENPAAGGAAEKDGVDAQNAADTPLATDSILEQHMTKDSLNFSDKISAESASSTKGKADVSGLGSKITENYSYDGNVDYAVTITYDNGMSIVCSVTDPMKNIDAFLWIKSFHNIFAPFGAWIVLVDVILGLLCVILFIFLMMAAGRRAYDGPDFEDSAGEGEGFRQGTEADTEDIETEDGCAADGITAGEKVAVKRETEKAKMRSQRRLEKAEQRAAQRAAQGYRIAASAADRIPFDLFLLIFLTLLGSMIAVDIAFVESVGYMPWGSPPASQTYLILCAAAAAAVVQIVLCILFSMSCAVRFKLGGWWRNSLLWHILVWLAGILGKAGQKLLGPLWNGMKETVRNIAIQWKLAAVFILVVAINLFAGHQMGWYGGRFPIILGILFDIAAFLVVMAVGMMLRKLQKGGRALANGDLDAKVDTSNMIGEFREHGENLNNISRGMAIAIEQRMKSERMKTELITNVSHDIKTPLTSIVNYVDLLSKENLEGQAAEYTEVLVRQSARLKKLTEDLVEASKASTGNINVSLQRINICETVNQAVGEYAERLQEASLSAVADFPDHPVIAEADGRLLWRILDNLLSNVCKYSMPGTRVYITVSELQTGGFAANSPADGGSRTGSFRSENPSDISGKNGLKKYFGREPLRQNKDGKNQKIWDSQGYERDQSADNVKGYDLLTGRVSITVKNISRERLNVATDELMERFVRGDSARTTEGSGLGLNIARSLTELQGGAFGLSIDGDLFKAEIILKSE